MAKMMHELSPVIVHNLLCHKHVDMAILCLQSLIGYSVRPISLMLHDDGTLTPKDLCKLEEALPQARLQSRKDADQIILNKLEKYPFCREFRTENVMALKVFDIALTGEHEFGYCDSDVLFFHPFDHLFEFPNTRTDAIFMQDTMDAYSLRFWNLFGPNAIKVVSKFNSGLMFLRSSLLDLEFLEWLLALKRVQVDLRNLPFHFDQTCWAVLAYRTNCRFWNPEQIAIPKQTEPHLPAQAIAAQYITPVRHLLPQTISTAVNREDLRPVICDTLPAKPLTRAKMLCARLARYSAMVFPSNCAF